jgi:Tol biopolymer transport system component
MTNGYRRALTLLLILLSGVLMVPLTEAQFTHTQITFSNAGENKNPSVSGDGTKIALISSSDLTGGNADGNEEIFLWTAGLGFTQITNTNGGFNIDPAINSDGTKIAFRSNRDLTGGNAGLGEQIFLWTSGSGFTQITFPTPNNGGPAFPSINSDGTKVAFEATDDYTGGNADGNVEIFLWTAGSGITQLTSSTGCSNAAPAINSDGSRIAFSSECNLTGGNADLNDEVVLWTSGSGFVQITSTTGGSNIEPSINSDGSQFAFRSNRDLTGGNADANEEIFLWVSGSGFTQISSSTGGANTFPSINGDGTKIAFNSNRDLTGGNGDLNREVFLWTPGSGNTQVTNSTGGGNFGPAISSDGAMIAFFSDRDLSGGNADLNLEIFLSAPSAAGAVAVPAVSGWTEVGMLALLSLLGFAALRRSRPA